MYLNFLKLKKSQVTKGSSLMEATLPPVGKDGCSPSQLRFFKVSLASEAGFGSMLSALTQLQLLCWPQEGN